jgi:transcription-repair coupling factor (superfamily II helicase)
VPALLPGEYCADVHERLVIYKRLANCDGLDQLEALREELIDRFGALPQPTRALIDSHRLRILGKPLGIARVDATESAIVLQFVPRPPIEPAKVLHLVKTRPGYRLAGQDRLRIETRLSDYGERVEVIRRAFSELA